MDKNTITGFVLIGVLLFAFSWLSRPSQEELAQKRTQDSISRVEYARMQEENALASQRQTLLADSLAKNQSDSVKDTRLHNMYGAFAVSATGTDTTYTLENDLIVLKFSSKGGQLLSAQLKEYTAYDSTSLMLFDETESQFGLTFTTNDNRVINTEELYFQPVSNNQDALTMRLKAGEGRYIDFVYSIHPDDYLLDFKVVPVGMDQVLSPGYTSIDLRWKQKMRQQELGRKFEDQRTQLYFKYATDDVDYMSESKEEVKAVSNRVKWIGYKGQYFSTVLIANDSFESSNLETKIYKYGKYTKELSSNSVVPFNPRENEPVSFVFYFGPNKYKLLKSYDETKFEGLNLQLEKLVPLGWSLFRFVNQWVIIPIFDWLVKLCNNLGLAIFLLTLIIKIALFPLSRKSLVSSAKMKLLKPNIEELSKKYPGQENAMALQQKTMELYRKAGASPMSGCLPMFLQMPFWIALFMFFPSAIELRHQSFLWAGDLSTYDAVISWKANVPFISDYFGNHISLFCLLMTVVNVIYTKFNMEQTNPGGQQMPGMKWMMYLMPVMMLVFLNQYPAGLNYYYFISTLITILQTLAFRYFMNEEKLRLQIESNMKKPVKKSGFMAKLEDAQKKQQELQRQQKKTKGGNR